MKTLVLLLWRLFFLLPLVTAAETTPDQGKLYTRIYTIDAAQFLTGLKHLAAPAVTESNHEMLLRYFSENKIVLPKDGACLLDEKNNRLLVRSTVEQLDKILPLVEKIRAVK